MARRNATWTNGRSLLRGNYEYYWAGNAWIIQTERPVTYQHGRMASAFSVLGGDVPEFGVWRFVSSHSSASKQCPE